jgi:hypothetical protein
MLLRTDALAVLEHAADHRRGLAWPSGPTERPSTSSEMPPRGEAGDGGDIAAVPGGGDARERLLEVLRGAAAGPRQRPGAQDGGAPSMPGTGERGA